MRNYTAVNTIKEDYARVMLWNVITRYAATVRKGITRGNGYLNVHLCILISLGVFVTACCGECPRQTPGVQAVAVACFTNFSTHQANLRKSNKQLFSGIDVEILRLFCSSYIQATYCIRELANVCPQSRQSEIESVLKTIPGVGEETKDLCRTDRLYELYAQKMRCFMERGTKSDWCYSNHINKTALATYTHEQLCSRVQTATRCIEVNIRHGCGQEAAELAHLLIRPVVGPVVSCQQIFVQPTPDDTASHNAGKQSTHASAKKTKHTNGGSSLHKLEFNVAARLLPLELSLIAYLIKKTFPS